MKVKKYYELECLFSQKEIIRRYSVVLSKLQTVYALILEVIKPLQLVGQAAEFTVKFESNLKLEPLQVIW